MDCTYPHARAPTHEPLGNAIFRIESTADALSGALDRMTALTGKPGIEVTDIEPANKDTDGEGGPMWVLQLPQTWQPIFDLIKDTLGELGIRHPGLYPVLKEQQRKVPRAQIWEGSPDSAGSMGLLNLDSESIRTYVQSYERNIQNMHPLIAPEELREMVSEMSRRSRPSRSPETAIVLFVLGLGKICLWNDKKPPDIVPESDGATPSSAPSQSSGQTSLRERSLFSQRPALSNGDRLPGFEYFAVAKAILVDHIGVGGLQCIRANILAGLYMGQLGYPLQSMEYITSASRGLQSFIIP